MSLDEETTSFVFRLYPPIQSDLISAFTVSKNETTRTALRKDELLEACKADPLMKDTRGLRVNRHDLERTRSEKGFREDAFLKYPITWDRSWRW